MLVTGSSKGACISAQGTAFPSGPKSAPTHDQGGRARSTRLDHNTQSTSDWRSICSPPIQTSLIRWLTFSLVSALVCDTGNSLLPLFSHTFTAITGQALLRTVVKAQSGTGKAKCSHLPAAVKLTWPARPASRCVHGLFSHLNPHSLIPTPHCCSLSKGDFQQPFFKLIFFINLFLFLYKKLSHLL